MNKKGAVAITWESIVIIIITLIVILVAMFMIYHYTKQGGDAIGILGGLL